MIVVIARLNARPNSVKQLEAELRNLLESTRTEPGAVIYTIQQGLENPLLWNVYEVYRNQEAMDAHMNSPHLRAFLEKVPLLLSTPPHVEVLTLRDAIGFTAIFE